MHGSFNIFMYYLILPGLQQCISALGVYPALIPEELSILGDMVQKILRFPPSDMYCTKFPLILGFGMTLSSEKVYS